MMNTKTKRSNSGFTMTELLATIAIIGIVSALAFVSISQYQRAAYQNEMDETAKQIYIAAQNHLTVASSLGTLPTSSADATSKKTQGTADAVTAEGQEANAGIYYYVVPADKANLENKKSMLYTMLPPGSIDETVRSNGSYIIRYQCNDSAVQVLDVFYSNVRSDRFLQSGFAYTLTGDDFGTLFAQGANYRNTNDAGKDARANYNGAIIGYYGGADAAGSAESLPTPLLEISNAEELTARLTNPHAFGADVKFEFYAIGQTSGAISKAITADATNVTTRDGKSCIEAVFDSVTRPNAHFAQLDTINEIDFIPGENIKIQVFALDSNSTKVSKSAKRTTNSLFASISTMGMTDLIEAFKAFASGGVFAPQTAVGTKPAVAKISNIRHLENMSNAISAYVPNALGAAMTPASYEQTKNLSWPDFCKAVVGLAPDASGQMPADTAASQAIRIIPITGDSTKAHTFMPVDWAASNGTLEYKGNALKIEDVEVDNAGDAGLFGSVSNGSISNLELVDFQVTTSNGNAGALAGTADNVSISNVLARHETTSNSSMITGAANAGGLVGAMTGGSVTGCAAAVYVSASGAAGGLVGSASETAVQYSYAAGHTNNGKYEGDRFASNVLSSGGYAGGLIGSWSGSTLANCYSTCSVRSESDMAANRLVGSGATGTNCYAVGALNDEPWDLTAVDGSVLTAAVYDATVAGGNQQAVPYDATLASRYGNVYPLKAIAAFDGASAVIGSDDSPTTLVKHLNAHYGDWPAIVTLVVND